MPHNAVHSTAQSETPLLAPQSSDRIDSTVQKFSNININNARGREKSKLDDFFKVKESSLKPEQRAL
jgi:hypothetical protein